MKQSAKPALFSLLFLISTIFIGTLSAAPSGEAANPFNQFTDPSGGVSLFTGSSSYTHPLLSLSSKGAVGLPINLAYSGNVELNARATNEIAPTSWVGLGWSLGFGSIIANHNNTQTLMDDSYTWISPEGVAYPIYLYQNGLFCVKNRMYVKVKRYDNKSGANTWGDRVYGWEITDESGNVFKYGRTSATEVENGTNPEASKLSTWYTFCWAADKYVGEGFNGEPEPYAYRWDLAEMRDHEGNWIRFRYEQSNEDVSYNVSETVRWQPVNRLYTRESHIDEIISNNGSKV